MSKDAYEMRIYCTTGLWDRLWAAARGTMEEQGTAITTQRGQMSWTCDLYERGQHVATCKRGAWVPVS